MGLLAPLTGLTAGMVMRVSARFRPRALRGFACSLHRWFGLERSAVQFGQVVAAESKMVRGYVFFEVRY